MKHYWEEVISPRTFGGSAEVKHAIRCLICEKQIIVTTRELTFFANDECPGHPPSIIIEKEPNAPSS